MVWCNAWWSLFPSALLLLLFSDIYFWGKGINKLIKYDCWFILFNIYFSWIHCWFLRHIWCKYNILYVFMFYVFNERKEKIWKHNLYLAPPSTINHQPSSSAGVHSNAFVLLWCAVVDGVGFNSCSNAPEYPKVSLFLQSHIRRYSWCSIIKPALSPGRRERERFLSSTHFPINKIICLDSNNLI